MEQRHLDVLQHVKAAVTVPVAVKLGPYFSSTGEIALRLDEAGADALVLFNRFLPPDIDLETLDDRVQGGALEPGRRPSPANLDSAVTRTAARRTPATTGVEALPIAACLLAGADVVMSASALLRHGPEHATVLLDGLSAWMSAQGIPDSRRGAWHARRPTRRRRSRVRARWLRKSDAGGQRRRLRPVVSLGIRKLAQARKLAQGDARARPRP